MLMLIKAADGNHLSSPRMAALLVPLGLTENSWIYNPSFTIVAWLLCLMDYSGLIARCTKQAHHVNNTRPRNKPTSALTCLCGLKTAAASRLLTAILSLQNSSIGVNVNLPFYIIMSVLLLMLNWSRSCFHTSLLTQIPVSYVWSPNPAVLRPWDAESGWHHRLSSSKQVDLVCSSPRDNV